MNNESVTPQYNDDEISLKELVLKLGEFWQELWRGKWLIAAVIIPFLAFMLYRAINEPVTYSTKLTFMVDNESASGMGAMSGILGSFGLGGAGGDYNIDKMLALVRSRKIIQTVLFQKEKIDGKEDYYANHLINIYDLHENWKEDTTGLKNFLFTHDSIPTFTLPENNALKILHGFVVGDPDKGLTALLETSSSETTGIMSLDMKTENEALSIYMVEDIFQTLSTYYIEKAIEKQQHTYDAIKFKTDSTLTELRAAEYALANFKDSNFGLRTKKDQLTPIRLEAKVRMLYTMYGEALKNLELTEFALRDQTPVVQVIDLPIPPIEPKDGSLFKAIIIACLLGGFLGGGYIIGRKIIRDAMAEA